MNALTGLTLLLALQTGGELLARAFALRGLILLAGAVAIRFDDPHRAEEQRAFTPCGFGVQRLRVRGRHFFRIREQGTGHGAFIPAERGG